MILIYNAVLSDIVLNNSNNNTQWLTHNVVQCARSCWQGFAVRTSFLLSELGTFSLGVLWMSKLGWWSNTDQGYLSVRTRADGVGGGNMMEVKADRTPKAWADGERRNWRCVSAETAHVNVVPLMSCGSDSGLPWDVIWSRALSYLRDRLPGAKPQEYTVLNRYR